MVSKPKVRVASSHLKAFNKKTMDMEYKGCESVHAYEVCRGEKTQGDLPYLNRLSGEAYRSPYCPRQHLRARAGGIFI